MLGYKNMSHGVTEMKMIKNTTKWTNSPFLQNFIAATQNVTQYMLVCMPDDIGEHS